MLVAHLVPGYFAAVHSRPRWMPNWSRLQIAGLWTAALVSTFAPDMDVIYNAVFRGFINHSTLWTHSLFAHAGIVACWWVLRRTGRRPYLQTLVGLIAIGGLSHLVLDVLSHGTPLLYPLSLRMFGTPSTRVLEGGFWAYVTDPSFLVEPLLVALAVAHWCMGRKWAPPIKKIALFGLAGGLVVFAVAFLLLLPMLQGRVSIPGAG